MRLDHLEAHQYGRDQVQSCFYSAFICFFLLNFIPRKLTGKIDPTGRRTRGIFYLKPVLNGWVSGHLTVLNSR